MPALLSKIVANAAPKRLAALPNLWTVFKRHGHARVMFRTANMTTWMRTKDHVHFYWLLGLIMFGGTAAFFNVVYGPCQLVDIPEGYEPRYWQYDRVAMVQSMQKLGIWDNPQAEFEQWLGSWQEAMNKWQWEREEKRARRLMYERQDYKAWYYVPYTAKWIEWSHWEFEANRRNADFLRQPS